jgi:hypothetical protein
MAESRNAESWRSPLTLSDLTADLVWPRLLRAGGLALRPSRLGVGFFYLIGLMVLLHVADLVDGSEHSVLIAAWNEWLAHVRGLVGACVRLDGADAGQAVNGLFISAVWNLVRDHTLIGVLFIPAVLLWTTVMGGAISRMAAMDFAQGVGLSWPEGVGYALGRWASFAGSVMGPLALLYGIALAMAVGGFVLFSVPVLDVIGGLLWVLFLVGALVGTVIMIAMTLGGPMLVPGVACEGTDAIDSVQHAYSYVFARPLRLLAYLAVLVAQFLALWLVAGAVVWLVGHFSQHAAGVFAGAAADRVIAGERGLGGTGGVASGFVRFWSVLPAMLGGAFAVSYFWCAATVLYLCMRRICDGQDISEVWVDTVVPGTAAERRTPGAASPAESVQDNGPADEN